ncbi:phosphopantetheine-binding protein [Streptomyces niveus]|uniref:phosphopantetheine-binding protein n=1 Tax=Streptomyces niveus TaxID=193462 RepID=UPI0036A5C979
MSSSSAEENTLRALFAEVLELEPESVGLDDDFFNLGGHSQSAIQLVVRIRSRLGVKLSVGDVFAEPTASGLATRLTRAPKASPSIRRLPRGETTT